MWRKLMILLCGLMLIVAGCGARPAGSGDTPPTPTTPPPQTTTPPPQTITPPVHTTPPVTAQPQPEPAVKAVALFNLAEIIGGRQEPARRWALDPGLKLGTALIMGPDGETALIYPADIMAPGDPPQLIHLPTGKRTPLAAAAKESWVAWAGWLPNGQIALMGSGTLYVGAPDGLKATPHKLNAWVTAPAPDRSRLAAWGPLSEGKVHVVTLATGEIRALAGPFRRCAQDGAVTLAWSPDGKQLAGTDCDSDTDGRGRRTRIVDAGTGATVRTVEGVAPLAWLPNGNLLGMRPPGGEKLELALLSPEGQELKVLPWGYPSPDGKYLLVNDYKQQNSLLEIATGKQFPLPPMPFPRWTPAGQIIRMDIS